MTGIDLFKALGGVKEEYIAEADGSRKLPHVKNVTLQWCAALAACVCLLLGWGFIAQHLGGIADYTGDERKSQAPPRPRRQTAQIRAPRPPSAARSFCLCASRQKHSP